MTKIPFTLEAWLKDKSQKVVDKDGRPVRIVCTDADGLYPIIGLVDNKIPLPCGKDGRPPYIGGGGGTLFLVTPEPELSEFEKAVRDVASYAISLSATEPDKPIAEFAKEYAPKLLELAKKEVPKDLPRWKPAARAYDGDRLPRIDWSLNRLVARFEEGIFYLDIRELYKLPGFKEDSHE